MKKKYDVTLEYVMHKTVTVELEEEVADDILIGDYPTFDIPDMEDSEEVIIADIEESKEAIPKRQPFSSESLRNEIEKALRKYSSDNVDIMLNEETDWIYLGYHSDNNSFDISDDLYPREEIKIKDVQKLADEYGLGICF